MTEKDSAEYIIVYLLGHLQYGFTVVVMYILNISLTAERYLHHLLLNTGLNANSVSSV